MEKITPCKGNKMKTQKQGVNPVELMKKVLGIFLFILIFIGISCAILNDSRSNRTRHDDLSVRPLERNEEWHYVEWNGHRYVKWHYLNRGGITHDPDCPCKKVE